MQDAQVTKSLPLKNMQKITKHELLGHLMYHDNNGLVGRASDFFQDWWAEVTHGAKKWWVIF